MLRRPGLELWALPGVSKAERGLCAPPLHCAPPPQKDLREAGVLLCWACWPDQPSSTRAVGSLETPLTGGKSALGSCHWGRGSVLELQG